LLQVECGGQCSYRQILHDIKNFNQCDSKTQENTYMSKVEVQKVLINKWII
jgi:hypothetical protein